jgi:8-oxo-dGTP pyrophosphatase MutT (NUDIX family)
MRIAEKPVVVVRVIVSDERDRVLILQREMASTGGGRWCLPGGKVDYGETVEAAAERELREETGLQASELRFLFYQDSLPPIAGEMHCINFYFRCIGAGSPALNSESTDLAWVGPDDTAGFDIAFRNEEGMARYWAESGA